MNINIVCDISYVTYDMSWYYHDKCHLSWISTHFYINCHPVCTNCRAYTVRHISDIIIYDLITIGYWKDVLIIRFETTLSQKRKWQKTFLIIIAACKCSVFVVLDPSNQKRGSYARNERSLPIFFHFIIEEVRFYTVLLKSNPICSDFLAQSNTIHLKRI